MEVRSVKQIGSYSGRLRRVEIALLVPDHEASVNIHCVPLKQRFNHSWLRLATIAEDTVPLNQAVRMMGAELKRIDMRTNAGKLTRHPVVQIANMPFFIKSPRNSRLVRYDKRKIPGVINRLHSLLGSLHPPDLVRIESIALVLVEDAIAIEENCRTLQSTVAQVSGYPPIFQQSPLHCNMSQGADEFCPCTPASSLLLMRRLYSFCHFETKAASLALV